MIIVWCLLGAGGLGILIAAINTKNSSACHGFQIDINGGGKALFVNKKDLITMLESDGLKDLHNKKMASFDLLKMENILRKNNWIKDAQLYFDNNQILKLRIQEREPVARLFTISGSSFLIDSNGVQLPLPEKSVFELPVFTGYPNEKFGLRHDSVLCRQIRDLAGFLNQDSFWLNQIQEVHIDPSKTFRMTTLIGNQEIEFGDGSDYANKFRRLLLFYKEVATHTGFEKYAAINIAYANQIVATRKQGMVSRVDSIQGRKNVMEMIRMAQKIETDTSDIRNAKPLEKNTVTEQSLRSYDMPEENDNKSETNNKHQKQQ